MLIKFVTQVVLEQVVAVVVVCRPHPALPAQRGRVIRVAQQGGRVEVEGMEMHQYRDCQPSPS